MEIEIDKFYEERRHEREVSSPLTLRTLFTAFLLHLAAFGLFWIAAKIIYRAPDVIIPIDMTIVPPWAEQDPNDPEPDPNPPPQEQPKPEPPKPQPKPEEPPKVDEKVEAVEKIPEKPKKKEFKKSEIKQPEKKKVVVARPAAKAEAPASAPAAGKVNVNNALKAPLPGVITEVKVAVGDEVKAGDTVVVLEAMKMANNLDAETDGKVTAILVKEGDSVMEDTPLVVIE